MSWKYLAAAMPARVMDRLGLAPRPRTPAAYVVERANWSTRWDGLGICRAIEAFAPSSIEVVDRPANLARRLVHFGSQFQWVVWRKALAASNRFVATFFHGKPSDEPEMARHVDAFLESLPRLERVVTAATMIEQRLIGWGVPPDKLVRIPIGVDTAAFSPAGAEQRRTARARYGIAPDALVIGSFQKDGVGWGEGGEPKLIKGPDVLCEVAARVARERPVFVLLTGPARGYVKERLRQAGIPFAHDYLDDYADLPSRYAALDIYLNPSREEGGPKGILEAMASGVAVASTRVGMAPDVIVDGVSGALADVGDVDTLSRSILEIDADPARRDRMLAAARSAVLGCDWTVVGRQHYDLVYRPLLDMAG